MSSNAKGLTANCWPVFEFMTNFTRQVHHGNVPPPDQVRYEALSALRDAEDLARNDPATERLWDEKVKAMLVYSIDYKMLNTSWEGRDFWFNSLMELDAEVLNHAEALGGEEFFRDCDDLQREYELAERRERRDRHELAELLSLYFSCLALGFKGQYYDRPQELADYTRRLFNRLPAYSSTRAGEMFPEAYKHNQEIKVDYRLGTSLAIVLSVFGAMIVFWILISQLAWRTAVGGISREAEAWRQGVPQTDVADEASKDVTAGSH